MSGMERRLPAFDMARTAERRLQVSGVESAGERRMSPGTGPVDGVEAIDVAYQVLDSRWVCPECRSGIPFPAIACPTCSQASRLPGARGLTSTLIGAALGVGALIAGLATLGTGTG